MVRIPLFVVAVILVGMRHIMVLSNVLIVRKVGVKMAQQMLNVKYVYQVFSVKMLGHIFALNVQKAQLQSHKVSPIVILVMLDHLPMTVKYVQLVHLE